MLNDKTAMLIKTEETYPNGANVPTIINTYQCPCGEGTIEYSHIPYFGDRYGLILCKRCDKEYRIKLGCGTLWELEKK